MGINQSNPTCEANACLNRVIGISTYDGANQWLSCVKTYSSAQQETVTLAPLNTYTSTITATASSTHIIVEIRTTEVTVYSTSTSYLQVLETVTAYTTTSILTASTTVTAANSPVLKAKRHKKRGGGCKPTSTTLSAVPSSVTPSSAGPSSVAPSSIVSSSSSAAVSASASTSSTPESSSTTTPPPGPVSVAPDCPNVDAYSSACSCIWAASDATRTTTSQASDTTILVTETATVAAPSISTDWTTNTVTVTVLEGATTTITSTISTGMVTTTTTTSTCPASAPTETGELAVVGGAYNGQVLINNNPIVVVTTGTGLKAVVARAGGQPYLANDPGVKMWITYQQSLGRVYFARVGNPGTTYTAVSCSVSDANVLSCQAGNLAVDTFFTIPSNGQIYMANAAYLSTRTTPYDVISFKVLTC